MSNMKPQPALTPHLKFEVTVMCAFDILCDVDQVRAAFLRAVRTADFAIPGICQVYVEPLPDGTVLGPKKRFRLTVTPVEPEAEGVVALSGGGDSIESDARE
jgi:hypothetical protein